MAETALGKIYWACDQQQPQANAEDCNNVLVFTILPALAQNSVFEQALRQVLPAYQQDIPSQPHVIDNGKEADGTRWMVLKNIRGMLLTERLQELDDRGMPQDQALEILHGLSQAVGDHRPQGVFGFLEPGAVLADEHHGYCLLGAPIATALRLASTGIIATPDNRQTFHSSFISPEVALGDQPVSRDDTFSLACIAYNLLQGHPPFGQQTTLEAAVRNFAPPSISKLKPDTWAALQQGLSLKREQRQATPPALLTGLQTSHHPRMLLPIAALSLASVVAYASYYLFSSSDTPPVSPQDVQLINPAQTPALETPTGMSNPSLVGETSAPTALDQESVQAASARRAAENAAQAEETARIESLKREAEAQANAELAAADIAKTEAQQQTISDLLKRAESAMRQGNLLSSNSNRPAAADHLRKVLAIDPENVAAKKMLIQMVNDQHTEAASLLENGRNDEAAAVLAASDKLITDFTLTGSLQRQVQLETQAERPNQEHGKASQYIERANHAIEYGNLMQGDDHSGSAVGYISALFDAFPDNPEGTKLLEKVVRTQHERASSALRKGNTDNARQQLNDSQKLIGQYTLDNLVEEQLDLERRYRDVGLMGIAPAGTDLPTEPRRNMDAMQQGSRQDRNKPTAQDRPARTPPTITASKPENPAPAVETPAPPETVPTDKPATPPTETVPADKPATPPTETIPADKPAEPPPETTPADKPATPPTETAPPEKTALTPSEPPPVQEVPVPPDVPVTETPPATGSTGTTEMPPVQLDTTPVPPPPEAANVPVPEVDVTAPTPPAVTPDTEFTMPTAPATGNSFTPDVSGITELPLDLGAEPPPKKEKLPTDKEPN
jgi:serine/threonine protein kinase